ncbi:MAG: hypothetical protein PHT27_02895 [Candidatus Izemoplasmatales bacterium]|nr:hypothetical protein [Candidatus Izemoplasmatales bacterium]
MRNSNTMDNLIGKTIDVYQQMFMGREFGQTQSSNKSPLGGHELLNHFVSHEVMAVFLETDRQSWASANCF